ncbi:MAG: hypothetical protein AAGI37_03850 [Planctomycetota bacterium]
MKPIWHCVIWSLLMSAPVCLADPPEVTAARTAAEKHNDTLEDASVRLERAIAAAQREHTKQIIAAKERMIVDLRTAYRTALRGKTPENAGTIERQIKRLEAQIEELKADSATPVEPKLKGLDPRLIGVVVFRTTPDNLGRAYQIDENGVVTVLFDHRGDLPGLAVGEKYQGVIQKGSLVVEMRGWTQTNVTNGRVKSFAVDNSGQLIIHWTHRDTFIKRGSKFNDTTDRLIQKYDEAHYDSVKDLPEGYHVKPNEEKHPPQRGEVDPDFVDDDNQGSNEDLDEEVDFFGIPIK